MAEIRQNASQIMTNRTFFFVDLAYLREGRCRGERIRIDEVSTGKSELDVRAR
jgi:hypothetical protein